MHQSWSREYGFSLLFVIVIKVMRVVSFHRCVKKLLFYREQYINSYWTHTGHITDIAICIVIIKSIDQSLVLFCNIYFHCINRKWSMTSVSRTPVYKMFKFYLQSSTIWVLSIKGDMRFGFPTFVYLTNRKVWPQHSKFTLYWVTTMLRVVATFIYLCLFSSR